VATSKERTDLILASTPWKEDDANWFAAHPDRSHRMRPMFEGEYPKIADQLASVPEHHEYQTIVRQLEVGRRIRTPFCRDARTEIPDLEPVLHAIFDLMSQKNETARVVTVAEIANLARKYEKAAEGRGSAN
jgi:hypothetical protein